jgi:MEDS: MEthanogen/methylotroph, DcmR Sensory domain
VTGTGEAVPTPNIDLGFKPGDHVCAFYNGGASYLDDVVVDFVSKGLRGGDKCICFVDRPSSVRERIPSHLLSRDGILQVFTEEQGYLPAGHFSTEAMIENLDATARAVLCDGYQRLWLIGDTSVIRRNSVDLKTWFVTEAEVSELAPRYPQFIMCMYDLDLYDGEMVMYVLKTHTRIFVNGLIIQNPYYRPRQQFLSELS